MKLPLSIALALLLAGCADHPANDVASRAHRQVCPIGYTETYPGSGVCETLQQQQDQQQQTGPLRQTVGGVMGSQPRPTGLLRR